MKQRRRILTGVFVGLLLALLAAWWLRPEPADAPASPAGGTNGASPVMPQATAPVTAPSTPADPMAARFVEALSLAISAEQTPLRFHGRAVDQTGAPVPGVRITTIHKWFADDWRTKPYGDGPAADRATNVLVSDAQGFFDLSGGMARSLYISDAEKAGHEWLGPERTGFFYYKPRSSTGSLPDFMDPNRRFVLPLWKKGDTEPLVAIQQIVHLRLPSVEDYAVSLMAERFSPILKISMHRSNGSDPLRQFDRLVSYTIQEGEIQETLDVFPYLAPLTGYSNQWVRAFEPSRLDRKIDDWRTNYYFRSRSGQIYGALTIIFQPHMERFSITGYMNPFGSPNLEPDPEKLITDEEEIRRLDETTRR